MMDLIDRKEAIKLYCNQMCGQESCNSCDMIHILENLPTAYDVDKVVNEMQKEITEKDDWQFSNAEIAYYNRGVRSCIEIVKKGGKK